MTLTPTDLAAFKAIGVSAYTLELAQFRRVTHVEARDICGIRYKSYHLEGIGIPNLDPDDDHVRAWRVRRDHPELDSSGQPIAKYVSAAGDRKLLYFGPGSYPGLSDVTTSGIIVESEKSVLSIGDAENIANRRHGLLIALGGCWGGRGVIGKATDQSGARVDEKGWLPDFDRVTWAGRDTVIAFDTNVSSNPKVKAARRALTSELAARGAKVRLLNLPIEAGVNGPDDYIGLHGAEKFFRLVDAAQEVTATEAGDSEPKDSQATIMVQLVREAGAELFHDDDQAYVHVPVGDHHETHKLRSRTGRAFLVSLFVDRFDRAPGSQAIADASNTLEALALRGNNHKVHVRIAAVDDKIYLDPCDATWRVVEVSKVGYRTIADCPVRFRRPKGLLPLPLPQPGGTIADLRPFVNVATDADFVMLVAVLVGFMRGRGPYPVLVENGEQGSGKSTTTRIIKALLDPNVAALRSSPREPRDLMIAAANSHVLGFDNLSDLPNWLSDAICRLATGGGFSTRTLYSDDEEAIFDAVRPVVLNGIPEFASRQDLVGRSVFVTLPSISDAQRRDESRFWSGFEQARPLLLGALLEIVTVALRNEASVILDKMPRMADFAKWIVAAEPACPWAPGTFLEVYGRKPSAGDRSNTRRRPTGRLPKNLWTSTVEWHGGRVVDALKRRHTRADPQQP